MRKRSHGFVTLVTKSMMISVLTWYLLGSSSFVPCGASVSAQDQVVEDKDDEDAESNDLNFLIRGQVSDVDGNPIVGATIRTAMPVVRSDQVLETKSRRNGAFALKVPAQGTYGPSLVVTDPSGELASFVSGYSYTTQQRKLFSVVLKPWRTTVVSVVDQDNIAVADAAVVLQASYLELTRQQTDDQGKATLKFPADAKVDWINALKSGKGYDYYENYDAFPSQDRLEVPEEITLVLAGAVPVTVTVIDDLKRPVPNAYVAPWTIKLPGKLSYANVGGALKEMTDADGVARVNWIPSNMNAGCTMLVYCEGFHCPKTPRFEIGKSTELTADVFRTCTVSGKVTYADGTPAAGIRLQGEGRGQTNHYFRGYTTTKDDGSYEIQIYPNQDTILAITDRNYAAESATGIELDPGDNAEANFQLGSGTLIHGLLTVGDDKGPMEGETATLVQKNNNASLVRWSQTDPEGYYHFRVGPGSYTLTLPSKAQMNVVVKDEEEIVHDSHIDRRPRGKLTGTVVDKDGKPLAGAEIRGESIRGLGHAGFKTQSDAKGQFTTERWMDEMFIYAVSRKERLAGLVTITDADKHVDLTLKPGAMVHGSAVDGEEKPVVKKRVQLSFSPLVGGGSVHFTLYTDDDGKYAFPAAVGVNCKAYLHIDNDSTDAPPITIDQAKRYEIQSFKVDLGGDE